MKAHPFLLFSLIISALIISIQSASCAETFANTWWKVAFDTPVVFSSPKEIGLDAVSLLHPKDSGPGKAGMEIVLIAVPKEMQGAFNNNDTEILGYIKTTFLALNSPAKDKVERAFFRKKSAGERHATTIPQNKSIEVYLLTLADGDKVALAFIRDAAMTGDAAEKIWAMVSSTFKEVPVRQ
jgi:hypothetical protein